MTPLGKLQENESISNLWDQERAFMSDASSEAIPPIFQEKVVPSCPKLRMWSISEELIEDPITTIITTKYPLVPALARGPNKTTPKSETTLTIPRQGETLVATHTVMSGYLLSERLLCPQSLTIHDREMRRRVRHRVLGVSTAIYQQVPP